MTNHELLTAISDMMDEKLDKKLDEKLDRILDDKLDRILDTKLDAKFDEKLAPVHLKLDGLENRMDGLEVQIKTTEKVLCNEIRQSEHLVLSEVERVHMILDKHMKDTELHAARHTA